MFNSPKDWLKIVSFLSVYSEQPVEVIYRVSSRLDTPIIYDLVAKGYARYHMSNTNKYLTKFQLSSLGHRIAVVHADISPWKHIAYWGIVSEAV